MTSRRHPQWHDALHLTRTKCCERHFWAHLRNLQFWQDANVKILQQVNKSCSCVLQKIVNIHCFEKSTIDKLKLTKYAAFNVFQLVQLEPGMQNELRCTSVWEILASKRLLQVFTCSCLTSIGFAILSVWKIFRMFINVCGTVAILWQCGLLVNTNERINGRSETGKQDIFWGKYDFRLLNAPIRIRSIRR